jgi:Flp pilus assembly protein TadB
MEFLVFFLILSVAVVFTILIANNVMRKRDVDHMRDLVSGKDPLAGKGAARQKSLMKTDARPARDRVTSAVLGQDLNQRLRNFIEQAGVDWDPARTVFMALILGVVGFNFFWYAVPRGEPISFIGLIAGIGGPFLYIHMRRRTRMR